MTFIGGGRACMWVKRNGSYVRFIHTFIPEDSSFLNSKWVSSKAPSIRASNTDLCRDSRASPFCPPGQIHFLLRFQRNLLEDGRLGQPECQRHGSGSPCNAVEVNACKEVVVITRVLVVSFVPSCSTTLHCRLLYSYINVVYVVPKVT